MSYLALDDDRMIELIAAMVRQAFKDFVAGYDAPKHPPAGRFLRAAGFIAHARALRRQARRSCRKGGWQLKGGYRHHV